MFETAAMAAKSSGWSPIRPRMSRSARPRSLALSAARRRDMAQWYAARLAGQIGDSGVQFRDPALGLGLHEHAAQDAHLVPVGLQARMPPRETVSGHGERADKDRVV